MILERNVIDAIIRHLQTRGEADTRSDLWALGCVLYEMATGRRAFQGKSQASLITSIMGSEPAPISQVAPLAPPGLERLAQACLAKDPTDRLQSAHDIRMQLAWLAEAARKPAWRALRVAPRPSPGSGAWLPRFGFAALYEQSDVGLLCDRHPAC